MDQFEEEAIHCLYSQIIEDLEPLPVSDYLYSVKILTTSFLQDLYKTEGRKDKSKMILQEVLKSADMKTFLFSLRITKQGFLADNLEGEIQKIQPLCTDNARKCLSHDSELILSCPPKYQIYGQKKQKLSILSHKLKQLSHNGEYAEFENRLNKIFLKCNLKNPENLPATTEQLYSDIKFIAFEARVANLRVLGLNTDDSFDKMMHIIPYTSNPSGCSMTFLARRGSFLAMTKAIKDGLEMVEIAKNHLEHVEPCKQTGMVYYIEINMLIQEYSMVPSIQLKGKILNQISLAISHFQQDSHVPISEDYTKMLYLKMAFCYLGINIDGSQIKNSIVMPEDVKCAQSCLDQFGDQFWKGMEKRRKMFYLIAKSVISQKKNQPDIGLMYIKESKRLAEEANLLKELSAISLLHDQLKAECQNTKIKLEELMSETGKLCA